jgi:predicted membrane chloride channel (bestrophin family)
MSPVVQCRADFTAMCSNAASARELWGCMMKKAEQISNDVCRDYVMGFRACTRDAEKKGSCVNPAADYATSVRRCLRSMPEMSISKECLTSRFYFPIAESRHAKYAA